MTGGNQEAEDATDRTGDPQPGGVGRVAEPKSETCRRESGSKEAEVGNMQGRSRERDRARVGTQPPRNSPASCKFT